MKELLKGEVADLGIGYAIKIEDAKLKIEASADLEKLVDKAAEAVPGQSPIELIVVSLVKQAVKGL